MRGARQAADARINELKVVDDFPENRGLFSKTKVALFCYIFIVSLRDIFIYHDFENRG
jgi:hypothetical protein